MDLFSTDLRIWLSFGISGAWGGGWTPNPPRYATETNVSYVDDLKLAEICSCSGPHCRKLWYFKKKCSLSSSCSLRQMTLFSMWWLKNRCGHVGSEHLSYLDITGNTYLTNLSAGQKISTLWNPNVYYHVHKSLKLVCPDPDELFLLSVASFILKSAHVQGTMYHIIQLAGWKRCQTIFTVKQSRWGVLQRTVFINKIRMLQRTVFINKIRLLQRTML
jgi:hypothetical protein